VSARDRFLPFLRRGWAALGLVALMAALTAALGATAMCTHKTDDAVVDTEMMAFLSEARALHHAATLRRESGDLPGAIDAMTRLVGAARPHPERRLPEIEEVLADAYARLAELRLEQGQVVEAKAAIEQGLGHAPGKTYFRGHLLEVQGFAEEAHAKELTDAGRPQEAERARERAIQLLEEVVKVQDEVIRSSLDGGKP